MPGYPQEDQDINSRLENIIEKQKWGKFCG
jgi:hypothetical protein